MHSRIVRFLILMAALFLIPTLTVAAQCYISQVNGHNDEFNDLVNMFNELLGEYDEPCDWDYEGGLTFDYLCSQFQGRRLALVSMERRLDRLDFRVRSLARQVPETMNNCSGNAYSYLWNLIDRVDEFQETIDVFEADLRNCGERIGDRIARYCD